MSFALVPILPPRQQLDESYLFPELESKWVSNRICGQVAPRKFTGPDGQGFNGVQLTSQVR